MPYASRYIPPPAADEGQDSRPMLGVIVPDLNNPVHIEYAYSIIRSGKKAGYKVLLGSAEDHPDIEKAQRDRLLSLGVKGLFVGSVSVELHALYQGLPVPCVLLGSRTQEQELDYVVLDDYHGAYLAFQRLVDCGHRRIAFLSYPKAQGYSALDRLNGFRKAVKRSEAGGLQVTIHTLPSEQLPDSYAAVKALLALEEHPTAIVAQNDFIAYGAVQAIRERGLALGRDVALVGFDDLLISSLPKMGLATVTCEGAPLAERAFALMMRRLREPSRLGRCGVLLAPRLINRPTFLGVKPC